MAFLIEAKFHQRNGQASCLSYILYSANENNSIKDFLQQCRLFPALPGTSRKLPALPGTSRKLPELPGTSRKLPELPGTSRKESCLVSMRMLLYAGRDCLEQTWSRLAC